MRASEEFGRKPPPIQKKRRVSFQRITAFSSLPR
jgi:hypothetical protein